MAAGLSCRGSVLGGGTGGAGLSLAWLYEGNIVVLVAAASRETIHHWEGGAACRGLRRVIGLLTETRVAASALTVSRDCGDKLWHV